MNRKATIFLLVAALVVVLCAVFLVPRKSGQGKPVGSPLFAFDPDDVSQIKITNGDEVFELRRTEDGWYIGPDPKDRASVDAVRRVIESALNTPVLDRIDAGELGDRDQLSGYGLKKSRVQFDFKGDQDPPLLIGKDSVDESRSYVRFEDAKDIYLIPDDLINVILSPPQDFRDRMTARLRPDRVDRILIKRPAGEIELRRQATGWQIIQPLSAAASDPAVEALLEKLLRMRIEGFESDADPGAMGLSEPVAEVQMFGEGATIPETIRVGSPAPQGGVFGRLEPRGVTVRLPNAIRETLTFDLASLRDTSLARINLDLVDLIRLKTPSATLTLRRKDSGWIIGDRPASSTVVQKMVDAFASAKSIAFEPATIAVLEKSGLAQPPLSVEFYSVVSENTPETTAGEQLVVSLKFGTRQDGGQLPVLKSGSPEIALVSDKILESIPLEESAWLSP